MTFKRAGVLFAFLLAGAVACSASITYNVDLTIGIGSVTGSITTDGTIGTLSNATGSITDWTLLLNDGAGTFTLNGPLSAGHNSSWAAPSSNVTATLSGLFFDFSFSGYLLFESASGADFVCFAGIGTHCGGYSTGIIDVCTICPPVGSEPKVDESVNVQIGTAEGVPEPSTFTLLGIGGVVLLGRANRHVLGNLRNRRRRF